MGIITTMRRQKAVYWAYLSVDTYGRPTWSAPVEIDCRWEDVNEEFLDEHSERQISMSKVYVDRDMKVGSVLMLGELDSGVDEDNPKDNDNAWEIRRFERLPNLKNTETLRTAIL